MQYAMSKCFAIMSTRLCEHTVWQQLQCLHDGRYLDAFQFQLNAQTGHEGILELDIPVGTPGAQQEWVQRLLNLCASA